MNPDLVLQGRSATRVKNMILLIYSNRLFELRELDGAAKLNFLNHLRQIGIGHGNAFGL
jgi:hypothetical protein